MDTIYIKAFEITHNYISVSLETLIIINIKKLCDSTIINLNVLLETPNDEARFKIFLNPNDYNVVNSDEIPQIATYCIWPVIVVGRTVVSGLCSVSRQIIKSSCDESIQHLLGFREATLVACSESSIWTKFCEIDMIGTIKNLLKNPPESDSIVLPDDLTRFEYHMEQPVRIHNVYKVAREKNNDKDIKSSVPLKDLNIPHCYSEGPFLTLADVILQPCLKILIDVFGMRIFQEHLPLVNIWFENMSTHKWLVIKFEILDKIHIPYTSDVVHANVLRQSLYTSDPKRYKPTSRVFTKQNSVENALSFVYNSKEVIVNDLKPFGDEVEFDWSKIPIDANPEGGALPKKRANRKCEQLENLTKAILKISEGKSYKIVDFCSGSGHLGLLLATLLPNCEVILVENKERSLLRARERVVSLNLPNVTLLQCNLDYFKAKFDVGVSLHACGVATDLVIQNCIENNAHFVSCPCCYGGIHDCDHLKYPRSDKFKDFIACSEYLNIAHAADQTHNNENVKTKQGYICMDVIDTDRKFYAEQFGYTVFLGKLLPTTCTPKNNLIVGICKS